MRAGWAAKKRVPWKRIGRTLARKTRPRKKRRGKPAAMAREADKLWSEIVRRRGACEIQSENSVHSGPLQAAHGFSRRYRNTRWTTENGFCLCAAHHMYYTHRPIEWDEYLRRVWGDNLYGFLRQLALSTKPPDVPAYLEALLSEHRGSVLVQE